MAISEHIKHQKTVLVLAGIAASFGFAPFYALPVFALMLIFALLICDEAESYIQSAKIGYAFGFGFFVGGFYWIANALLVDAATFGWLYPIAMIALGAFFGLFWVVPFMVWYFFKNTTVWCKIFGFASITVLFEYVRSFVLTGFPWNLLGTMFGFSDVFIQSASIIGTYGLSFLLVVTVLCFYALIKKHYRSGVLVFCVILSLMTVFGIARLKIYGNAPSDIKVRLVQPSIPQSLKWDQNALEDNLTDYINLSRQDGIDDVNFVLWGETATAFNPKESDYYQMLTSYAVPKNGYLMTGLLRYDEANDALYNSMSVLDDKGDTVAFYDKNHLVPFGEYLPLRQFLPDWVRPIANQMADFASGEKYKILDVKGLPKFGVLICYEVIFPDKVLNRNDKPQFLIVLSNDGWYGKSSGPYQHFVSAKMRAVEEGITIIRSANNGISALIDPLGRTLKSLDLNERGILDIDLPQNLSIQTIYSSFGGGVVIEFLMFIVFLITCALRFKLFV